MERLQEYTINIDDKALQIIALGLGELQAKISLNVINDLNNQVDRQLKTFNINLEIDKKSNKNKEKEIAKDEAKEKYKSRKT